MKRRLITSCIAKYPFLIIIIFVSVSYTTVEAQSIFLNKGQFGFLALAGYGASGKYDGSVEGIGVSINGFTDIGIAFSHLSHNGISDIILGITPDFLLKKQSVNSPVNVELSPGFTHTYYRSSYYGVHSGSSVVSLGMAISGELQSDPGLRMAPRVHASYGLILSSGANGATNLITAGLDWNIVIDVSDHVLIIIDPGFSSAININSTAGSIAGGFLIR